MTQRGRRRPRTLAAEAACIFCGSPEVTEEHLFSRWAGRTLAKDGRGLYRKGRHVVRVETIEQPAEHTWESQAILDFVARCVCAPCNTGWMSTIEKRAQPIISPMILGNQTVLDTSAREIVGTWVALKATVLRYGHVPRDPLPRQWLDHWYHHHLPPDTWSAWISAYVGRIPARYRGQRASVRVPKVPSLTSVTPTKDGVLATILIGQFAAQVFGVNWGASREHFPEHLLRVWPVFVPELASLVWPPRYYISDENLKAFEERLLTEIER